jgi:hypothetical protein
LAKVPEVNRVGAPYCHVTENFLTQAKFLGTYTIPRIEVMVTGTVQSLAGPEILAEYTASNTEIRPSLGRNLSGGARNVTLNLVSPGTMFGGRTNQFDLRFGKILRVGRTRATASLDLFNILNANSVVALSNRYATWQQPQGILNPRFAKLVLQLDF